MIYASSTSRPGERGIVQIISLASRNDQRNWLRLALDLVGRPYAMREVGNLDELMNDIDLSPFRLLLMPNAVFDLDPTILRWSRRRMPMAQIVVYGEFSADDVSSFRRIRDAGADVVLDSRVSPTKLAVLLERTLWLGVPPGNESASSSADGIRRALRLVAPSAA